jgi:hypothetical protein
LNCSTFRFITIIMAIISCAGCSVNGFGFPGSVEEQTTSTNMARVVTIKARGLHLYTQESFGIQLGYIERVLIYPVLTNNIQLCTVRLLNDSMDAPSYVGEFIYSNDAIQVKKQAYGLGFEMSAYTFSANIGVVSRLVYVQETSFGLSVAVSAEGVQKVSLVYDRDIYAIVPKIADDNEAMALFSINSVNIEGLDKMHVAEFVAAGAPAVTLAEDPNAVSKLRAKIYGK